MTTLIRATGQAWKLRAALVALGLTALATLFQYLGPKSTMVLAGLLVVLTGAVALGLVASVRCPGCRRSVGYWSMKTQSPTQWLPVLASLDECPYCHHRPRERESEAGDVRTDLEVPPVP